MFTIRNMPEFNVKTILKIRVPTRQCISVQL